MPADEILLDCEDHMEKALDHLKHELRGVRTGRANPAMVESVKVDYYGSPTDLKAISSINVPGGAQVLSKPFGPGALKASERASNDANLPMPPHSAGKTLRLTLPAMSQDVRLK